MLAEMRAALVIFVLLTAVTGIAYPLAVTGIAQGLFKHQANGSILEQDGKAVGSELIGQAFDRPEYFWGRPSATGPVPYNAASSSGSNLGPTNPALLEAVAARAKQFQDVDPDNPAAVPVELVTSSASGLDPHISPAAARYQVRRVAHARGWPEQRLLDLIERHLEGRTLGMLGEARVNVLKLNLDLDRLHDG
jgi:K+-transporting ATPase ATPase C chain